MKSGNWVKVTETGRDFFFPHIHLPDLDVFLGEAGDIQRADDGIFVLFTNGW